MMDAKASDGDEEGNDDAPTSDATSGSHRRCQEHLGRGRET
jgi:hypothetical protein